MKFFSILWKELRETFSNVNEPDHIRLVADLYWKALLLVGFSILVGVFSYSTWGVVRILGNLSVSLDTAPPPPPALNRSELTTVVRAFDERRTTFEALKANPSVSIKNPSL